MKVERRWCGMVERDVLSHHHGPGSILWDNLLGTCSSTSRVSFFRIGKRKNTSRVVSKTKRNEECGRTHRCGGSICKARLLRNRSIAPQPNTAVAAGAVVDSQVLPACVIFCGILFIVTTIVMEGITQLRRNQD